MSSEQTPGLISSHAQYVKYVPFPPSSLPLSPLSFIHLILQPSSNTPKYITFLSLFSYLFSCTYVLIRGVAEETIGNLSGSESWRLSGQQDKAEAIEHMRTVSSEPNLAGRSRGALETEGKIEKAAGWATGCAGMQHNGECKVQKSLE